MRVLVAASVMLATLLCFGQEKRKSTKPADVAVIEASVHRSDGKVALEGRVENRSAKTINGLTLYFDFIGTDGQVISTKRSPVDEDVLQPGGESSFHFETADPVRAVEYRIRGTEASGRDLRVEPSQAKPIE